MNTEPPQLAISRVFDAPRALVFKAFTDPDHLATWWGPSGNSLPRDEIEFDVRPGGFQRWTEVAAAEPDLRINVYTWARSASGSRASVTWASSADPTVRP